MSNNVKILTLLLVLSWFLFPAQKAQAIHKGAGGLVCGSCHTMHNSQGSMSLGGAAGTAPTGGTFVLLRADISTRADIHKLCLQCHAYNGSFANVSHAPQYVKAPKVLSSATWDRTDPFNLIGSGGNFSTELDATWDVTTGDTLGYGHSLGATNVRPPGGDEDIETFSCTNCHDPHGTSDEDDPDINIFRNLKVNALGAANNSGAKFLNNKVETWFTHRSYVGGVTVSDPTHATYFGGTETDNTGKVIWPVYRGTMTGNIVTDSPNSNSYATVPTFGSRAGVDKDSKTTMSRWCAQCHDYWHERIEKNLRRYPVAGGTYSGPLPEKDCGGDYLFLCREWQRHPVQTTIPRASVAGCASGCHPDMLDRSNYNLALIQAGMGLPVTANAFDNATFGALEDVYYLPEDDGFGAGGEMSAPGDGPKVFCLSCHFAHGGPYYDNLRWEYLSAVEAGGQTPNPIASNVGCQLCHNR